MASVVQRAFRLFSVLKQTISNTFIPPFPEDNLALVAVNLPILRQPERKQDLKEIIQSSILWAVPKRRKSIEKRRTKRFGSVDDFYKMYLPKTNLLVCTNCGSYHEAGVLCRTCYEKVMKETQEMQEEIKNSLGISPIEQDVVVLYTNDDRSNQSFFEGKRIVEMKKPRPKLFSDNLLQRSTEVESPKKEVTVVNETLK